MVRLYFSMFNVSLYAALAQNGDILVMIVIFLEILRQNSPGSA